MGHRFYHGAFKFIPFTNRSIVHRLIAFLLRLILAGGATPERAPAMKRGYFASLSMTWVGISPKAATGGLLVGINNNVILNEM
jgi:hypothetical protein